MDDANPERGEGAPGSDLARKCLWILFFGSNIVVLILAMADNIGRQDRWVCADCRAQLTYQPTYFARPIDLSPDPPTEATHRWRFQNPWYMLPWLPSNWLTILVFQGRPNPDALVKRYQENPTPMPTQGVRFR